MQPLNHTYAYAFASCNCFAAFLRNSIHAYAVALCNCAMALMLVLFLHVATPLHPVPRLHALLSRTSADAIVPCNYCATLRVCFHMQLLCWIQCRGSMLLPVQLCNGTHACAVSACSYSAASVHPCICCCPCSCTTALMYCRMLLLCNAQCRSSMQLLSCTSADAIATCLVAPMPTSAPRLKHRPGA